MDFQIADRQRKRRNRRLLFAGGGVATLVVLLILLGNIAPGVPEVNRSVVWTGVVERGELVRQVRGPGSLQVPPEQIRWLAAETRGAGRRAARATRHSRRGGHRAARALESRA